MNFKNTTAFSNVGKLYRLFTSKQKKTFKWLVFLTFVSSITDIMGLAFVIPVVGLVLTEGFHQTLIEYIPALAPLTKNQLLLSTVSLFVVLIISKNLFGLYINRLQIKFVENLFVTSSMNVLEKIYERSLPEILKQSSNTWVNKLSDMQMHLCSNIAVSTIIIINEAIVFALTAIIVCVWNWHLFFILIIVLAPSMGLFYARVKNMIKTAGIEKNKNYISLYANAQEMIFGYTDIKIAGTEKTFKNRFEATAKRYSIFQGKMDFTMFIPTRIIEVVIFVCIIIILLYGVYVIKDIDKIVTTITLFSMIAYRSIPSVNRFVMALNTLTAADYIMKDTDFIVDENKKKIIDNEQVSFNNKINFENVSYSYGAGTKNVISECNLEINKGEKIGIIGKSGAGKSTLVNNILGFLMPTSGQISVDGIPLTRRNLKSWWKIIGYVRQDVFIMNASLLENIAIGVPPEEVDINKVNHAVELASLSELVHDLPDGLHTILSERGNNLSGGQKQRIAIARAIYKGAELLIFDEATSSLDSKTEEEITNAIHQLGKANLTILIIAHRFTSLKHCDKIYTLEQGSVTNMLSYQQLMNEESFKNIKYPSDES